jgi:hypothetical protein
VAIVRFILRSFSLLFHGAFALLLLGLSVVSFLTGAHTFEFYILPWKGETLAYVLLGLAITGVLIVLLAMRGTARMVFFVWSLFVLALIVRGYFFSYYTFVPGSGQLQMALWVLLAAVIAAIGARLKARPAAARR